MAQSRTGSNPAAPRPEGETNLVPDRIDSSKPPLSGLIPERSVRKDRLLELRKNMEREYKKKERPNFPYAIGLGLAGGVVVGLWWTILDLLVYPASKDPTSTLGPSNLRHASSPPLNAL